MLCHIRIAGESEAAVSFYNKCGFKKFGERDFIFGIDIQKDWLMKKII